MNLCKSFCKKKSWPAFYHRRSNLLRIGPALIINKADPASTDTKAQLPEKVNLFVWATSRGVMLFSAPTNEIFANEVLHAHATNFFNEAEPLRGDPAITNICDIPPDCLRAMQAEADLY